MSTPRERRGLVIPGAVEVPGADIRHGQRASDADRTRVIRWLAVAHETGRIDGDVFTARMEAAAECVTMAGLAGLLADLPPLPAPPGLRLGARLRGLAGGQVRRRWLHAAGAVAALCWAIMIPVLIFTSTGYPVAYHDGRDTWVQTEHPGLPLAIMWLFIITGVVALVVDIVSWAAWEQED